MRDKAGSRASFNHFVNDQVMIDIMMGTEDVLNNVWSSGDEILLSQLPTVNDEEPRSPKITLPSNAERVAMTKQEY